VLRHLLSGIALNVVLPLVVYWLLRPHVGSDLVALAVGAAIPVIWTLGVLVVRHRVDPMGAFMVPAFAVVLVVLALSGGNPLVVKLHDAVVTGPLGLVCLLSVLVRRPLLLVALRLAARGRQRQPAAAVTATTAHTLSVLTGLLGATLAVHAALLLALARTMSTSAFLAIGKPIGWTVLAAGALVVFWYLRRKNTGAGRRTEARRKGGLRS
jgi:hypothetical protein